MENKVLTLTEQEVMHCKDEHGLALDSFGHFMYKRGLKQGFTGAAIACGLGIISGITVIVVERCVKRIKHDKEK